MNDNCIAALLVLDRMGEPLTTTDVARLVFNVSDDGEDIKNAERKVRYYFSDGYPHLVETVTDGGVEKYTLAPESVWFGSGQVRVVSTPDEEVLVGLGDVMVYQNEDDDPQVVNIGSDSLLQNSVSESDL